MHIWSKGREIFSLWRLINKIINEIKKLSREILYFFSTFWLVNVYMSSSYLRCYEPCNFLPGNILLIFSFLCQLSSNVFDRLILIILHRFYLIPVGGVFFWIFYWGVVLFLERTTPWWGIHDFHQTNCAYAIFLTPRVSLINSYRIGKNTLRPQQLNINVATWVRLLKRDVPAATRSPAVPTREEPSPQASTATPTVPTIPDEQHHDHHQHRHDHNESPAKQQAGRADFVAPVLPPKQSKHEQKVAVTPQPAPRIEEIEVGGYCCAHADLYVCVCVHWCVFTLVCVWVRMCEFSYFMLHCFNSHLISILWVVFSLETGSDGLKFPFLSNEGLAPL